MTETFLNSTPQAPQKMRSFKCAILFAHGKAALIAMEARDMTGALAQAAAMVNNQPARVVNVTVEEAQPAEQSRIVLARALPPKA